jgi:membrane protease YdiL (CAAX protease family)
MSPRRVLSFALTTQGLLIAVAWLCSRALDVPPRWGEPIRDVAVGMAAALALAGVNYLLLVRAPGNWIVDGVRSVYDEMLVPLFARLSTAGIIALGAAAGLGEEWLFRGVLQPTIGLVAASVVFGLAHVGGLKMLPFGVWATGMGLLMGSLAAVTGGLVAPIVAHGLYDMLALEYIRRGAYPE